jgi:hypothetical protein
MNTAERENLNSYLMDLNDRLGAYTAKTGECHREIIRYFKEEADPYNLKPPGEQYKEYCKLLNEFLTKAGY